MKKISEGLNNIKNTINVTMTDLNYKIQDNIKSLNNILLNSNNNLIDWENNLETLTLNKKYEDILFLHNYSYVRKFKYETKNVHPFFFIENDEFVITQNQLLEPEEVENIKTEQLLNILRPKIEKYLTYKDKEFNCTIIKNLYSYAEEIGLDNTLGCLFPIIEELPYRKEIDDSIVHSFIEGFDNLVQFVIDYSEDENQKSEILFKKILPVIEKLLNVKRDLNLLKFIAKSITKLINVSKTSEIYSEILPVIISLSNNDNNYIGKKIAIEIFNDNAKILGKDIIESYIIPQLESFSLESDRSLRLYCVTHLNNIFENISYETLKQKCIKVFQKLSGDEDKDIRQICCEMLPNLCKISRSELVSQHLLPLFVLFTFDAEEIVKTSSLAIFGEFIFYLQKEDIKTHPELLDFYIDHTKFLYDRKIQLNSSNLIIDNALYKCAFNFPSVLMSYCRKVSIKTWSKIKPIYLLLAKSNEFKFKKTISYSFPEISKILGQKISETEINPLVLEMYDSNNQEIKETIINIIPDYLNSIQDINIKKKYLSIIKERINSMKNTKAWRIKVNYLKVLGRLCGVFDNNILFNEILSICVKMCFEPVFKVRKKAAKTISKLIMQFLLSEDEYKIKSIVLLRMFATCKNFSYRQLFIHMCSKIIEDENIFLEIIYDLLDDLSHDKIVNVKVTLSCFLIKIWKKKQATFSWIKSNTNILEIIYRLLNDDCPDVKNNFKGVINIKDIELKLNINKIITIKSKILQKRKVNHTFTSKCDELKLYFGFIPNSIGTEWVKNKGK